MELREIERRATRIKLLLMDCDGVLTDGRIALSGADDEQKFFHTRDGQGLVLAQQAGLRTGIISGRKSRAVERRARELGMTYTRQGAQDKVKEYKELLADAGATAAETAFIGDDITDIPLMRCVGLAVAVADASAETRAAAHYVTTLPGGYGAVRETIELILQAQGRWPELLSRYTD